MNAFLYAMALQWKLDIRSKTLLITCYIVPLLFFAFMGSIFTSILPDAKNTLIQSMTVFGVTMGALIGLPPSLVERGSHLNWGYINKLLGVYPSVYYGINSFCCSTNYIRCAAPCKSVDAFYYFSPVDWGIA